MTSHSPQSTHAEKEKILTARGKKVTKTVAKWGSVIAGTAAATALAMSMPSCKKTIDPINTLSQGHGSWGETSQTGIEHDDIARQLTINNLVDSIKIRGKYNSEDLDKMMPSAAAFDSLWGYLNEHIGSPDTHSGFGISRNTHFSAKISVNHPKMKNGKQEKDSAGNLLYYTTQENAHYDLGITRNGDQRSIVITYHTVTDPIIRQELEKKAKAQNLTLLPDDHTIVINQYSPLGSVSQTDKYHADNRSIESDSDLTEAELIRLIKSLPGYKR